MSLDVWLEETKPTEVYWANITHNLTSMAEAAGIYTPLWRPEEMGASVAAEIIEPLAAGLERLKADPEFYRKFNASNGWGKYEHFVPFVEAYLNACQQNPGATIRVSL